MAEYSLTYYELAELVNQYITMSESRDNLENYRPAILAALTGSHEENSIQAVQATTSLWERQLQPPSQLLLGTKYVPIQQNMLEFLKEILVSGLLDGIIQKKEHTELGISVMAAVAFVLYKLFKSVKELDDWDFCIYMQAVCHYKTHKKFTIGELKSWMPHGEPLTCNMHNDKWDCSYLTDEDTCTVLNQENLKKSLVSLYNKGILISTGTNDEYTFKFPG